MPLGFSRVVEGDVLRAGGRDWTVRMGDGHAPEHVTLWSADGEVVIGGDQLLPSISPNLGVYATEPEADPVADWIAACERLMPHATAAQLVLPGHKLPYRGLPFRLAQLAENHHGALDRLRRHLARPSTAAELLRAALHAADRPGRVRAGAGRGDGALPAPVAPRRGDADRATRAVRGCGSYGRDSPG